MFILCFLIKVNLKINTCTLKIISMLIHFCNDATSEKVGVELVGPDLMNFK